MKKYTKFLFIFIISVFFISCSQNGITFGEVGMRLPNGKNDEKLQFNIVISNEDCDYLRKISGESGETFIIEDLDSGKYSINYDAYSLENPKVKYFGKTSASVYIGIFSPVKISIED